MSTSCPLMRSPERSVNVALSCAAKPVSATVAIDSATNIRFNMICLQLCRVRFYLGKKKLKHPSVAVRLSSARS